MSVSQRYRIALLPLDDRPVNILLPLDIARVASVEVDVPPAECLPAYREPGDTAALAAWLLDRAEDTATQQMVVSLDMLCFGGLIASRISGDTTRDAIAKLDVLRRIRSVRPDMKISAVTLVMRASDSYSAAEEPEYWENYGRELHRLGADIHRLNDAGDLPPVSIAPDLPDSVVSDFARRRIRNHIVNLSALSLVEDGTLDFLAVTADDTAEFSAGSAEQTWLRHWMHFLPRSDRVLMYPGADEVGAVLVARAVAERAEVVTRIRVVCPEPGGLELVPPFENVPLAQSIARQVTAVGAQQTLGQADVVLVVHAPDPERHDMFNGLPPTEHANPVELTVEAVRDALGSDQHVALADVRFSNGCDPALVRRLVEEGLLERLTSFGGWNTAGNTLGSVIAVAVAATVSEKSETLDRQALRQALITRVLDDYGYQSVIRPAISGTLFADQFPTEDRAELERAEKEIHTRLSHLLKTELPFEGWTITSLSLPWRRSFEVKLSVEYV